MFIFRIILKQSIQGVMMNKTAVFLKQTSERIKFSKNNPKFTFIPNYTKGISNNFVSVEVDGRLIGDLEAKDVVKFENGNVKLLDPVSNWEDFYNQELVDYLKLTPTIRRMRTKQKWDDFGK